MVLAGNGAVSGAASAGAPAARAAARSDAQGAPRLLIPSKLRPPRPRLQPVPRHAAVARLVASGEPLVVVSAPAGAGKTLLLAQWAEADARPAAWLQVDAADNDHVVFLTYVAAALAQVAPVDDDVFALLALGYPPVKERVLPLVAQALSAAPPFLLVLDEVDGLTDRRCWAIVAFLVENLPDGAQMALTSRIDPPLPLARLRAEGALLELRNDSLALDRAETAALLAGQVADVDDEIVDAVCTATEGWATGVSLAALAMRGRPAADWPPLLRGGQREIAAYLDG